MRALTTGWVHHDTRVADSAIAARGICQGVFALHPQALRELQDRKLRAAVRHAYESTPLYRERFDDAGVRPDDIRTVADLPLLPITAKQDFQTHDTNRIVAVGVDPDKCSTRRTSGSTGRPLIAYLTSGDERMRSLVELRSLIRLGVRARDINIVVGPERPRAKKLHERLGFFANDRISSNLPAGDLLERLVEMNPSVLSSAKTLDELLRRQARADLGIDPYSAYGANEVGRIAMECPKREGLHINSDHVVLESWRDGKPAAPGETGAALITSLNTTAMPLVRYRLGDRIRLLEKRCSCGSPLPLMDIPRGREGDVIVLPGGKTVSLFALTDALREYLDIVQFGIVQEAEDRLEIQLHTRSPCPDQKLREIRQRTLERLGQPMTVDVRAVESLPSDDLKSPLFSSKLSR